MEKQSKPAKDLNAHMNAIAMINTFFNKFNMKLSKFEVMLNPKSQVQSSKGTFEEPLNHKKVRSLLRREFDKYAKEQYRLLNTKIKITDQGFEIYREDGHSNN